MKSRFEGVFNSRKKIEREANDAPAEKGARKPKRQATGEAFETIEKRGPGRPPGKRTNPDYQSVTTFLHKQTYIDVQKALIGTGQDFGDIVDDLLKDWLSRNA